MPEVINFVIKQKLGVFDIGNKWIDIGNIYDYKKASREIKILVNEKSSFSCLRHPIKITR